MKNMDPDMSKDALWNKMKQEKTRGQKKKLNKQEYRSQVINKEKQP